MSYFDSAKNRAHWQAELEQLKAEKERREKGIPSGKEAAVKTNASGPVQRITFAQLVAEERAVSVRKDGRERSRTVVKSVMKHTPEKAAMSKGNSL